MAFWDPFQSSLPLCNDILLFCLSPDVRDWQTHSHPLSAIKLVAWSDLLTGVGMPNCFRVHQFCSSHWTKPHSARKEVGKICEKWAFFRSLGGVMLTERLSNWRRTQSRTTCVRLKLFLVWLESDRKHNVYFFKVNEKKPGQPKSFYLPPNIPSQFGHK